MSNPCADAGIDCATFGNAGAPAVAQAAKPIANSEPFMMSMVGARYRSGACLAQRFVLWWRHPHFAPAGLHQTRQRSLQKFGETFGTQRGN
jgi:hypothetical protein